MIEARWPDGVDADVDLWVQAPGDVPVGYSNKGGAIFNLLRDDLGQRADATGINYEVSYARGMPAGEYTANLHLYRNEARLRVPVTIVASVKTSAQDSTRQILATSVELSPRGPGAHRVPLPPRRRGRAWCRAASPACSKPLRDWQPS